MAAPLSCDQCEELLVDYLLHALETEAVSAVTEHLSTCDRCRAQREAYEAVLGQLAQAVPQQEPPAELGSRLLAEAVEGSMLTASTPEPLHPPRRSTVRPRWAFLLTAANVVLCLPWVGGLGTCRGRQHWCISAGRTCSANWPSSARPSR